MRKIYSLLLALFLLPLTMVGANQAISKAARSNGTDKSDSRAYVQPDIIRAPDNQPAPSFSVAAWVKIGKYSDALDSHNKMVVFGYGGREHCNDNGSWNFCVDPNGRPIITGWGGFEGVLSETPVSVNEWHYFTAVYDATTMSLSTYLDGVLLSNKVCTKSSVDWFTNETPAIYFGGYCFNGLIDEAHIWNKALTAQEVEVAKTFALGVDGLVGLYTFDEAPASAGTFANQSTQACASAEPCYFENVTGAQAWPNGVVYVISQGSYTLANPTLVESDRDVQSADPVDFYLLGDLFEEGRVELTATDGTNTYVVQEDAHKIIPGTVLTLDAQPAAGYALAGFVEYLNGGEKYFTNNTYMVITTGAEVAAYAVSEAGLWDMTVVNEPAIPFTMVDPWGRDVASNPTGLYGAGDDVSYNLTLGTVPAAYDPATVVVKLGEDVITAENGAYAIASAENATLTITVTEKAKYTVTINQPAVGGTVTVKNGAATVNSGDQVPAGTVLTLSKTAQTGYQFTNYIVNGTATTNSTVTVNADVTISAAFEEGALEYCTLTGTTQRSDSRGITSLSVSDNAGNSVSVAGPGIGTRQALYVDQTGTVFTTEPGARITIKNNGSGSWMHSYVYIDLNQNGVFEVNEANCRGTNVDGELMSHTGYTGINGSDPTQASDGSAIDYGTSYNLTMPSFTLPTDMAPGTYRVRHKVDWNCVDPCGRTSANGYSGNLISDNGGGIIDFVIRIESPDYDTPRTVSVAAANDAHGTVAITDPATDGNEVSTVQKAVTIKATPAEGYAFLNWTDANGNVVSTDATYTYTGEAAASFTANFGFALTFSVGENGSALFTVDGSAVASGVVLAPGTEVEVTATPSNGKFAQVVVNGSALVLTANVGTFTMEEETNVVVSFVDAIYTLTLNIIGDGDVKITDGGTPAAGPSGTEYTTGNNITDKSLRIWAKPADGGSLISISYIDEGSADATELRTQAVTSSSWTGWYFGSAGKAKGNRTITVEFTAAEPQEYTVTYSKVGNGSLKVQNAISGTISQIASGSVIESDIYVVVTERYPDTLVSLLVNGEESKDKLEIGGTYSYLMIAQADVTEDVVIEAEFTDQASGIEEIGIDPANGPIEYYNLQGVRIEVENLVPGFYIVRQGNKAAKVFIQK